MLSYISNWWNRSIFMIRKSLFCCRGAWLFITHVIPHPLPICCLQAHFHILLNGYFELIVWASKNGSTGSVYILIIKVDCTHMGWRLALYSLLDLAIDFTIRRLLVNFGLGVKNLFLNWTAVVIEGLSHDTLPLTVFHSCFEKCLLMQLWQEIFGLQGGVHIASDCMMLRLISRDCTIFTLTIRSNQLSCSWIYWFDLFLWCI